MCTGIRLSAKNGDIVYGRTLEFDTAVPATLGYMPRGQAFRGSTPTGNDGLAWTNDYAYGGHLGELAFGDTILLGGGDLINEHGLVCGIFNLPGYTAFTDVTDDNRSRIIASWEVPSFVAGTYKTTAEARAGIQAGDFIVGATPFPLPRKPGQFPQHVRVGDATGDTIVIEWHTANGMPTIYDSEPNTITHSGASRSTISDRPLSNSDFSSRSRREP